MKRTERQIAQKTAVIAADCRHTRCWTQELAEKAQAIDIHSHPSNGAVSLSASLK